MTIQRLNAQSVKVQLRPDEAAKFLAASDTKPSDDSARMLSLIACLLEQAESVSGIPFSRTGVTVELMTPNSGGLIVYFTAQSTAKRHRIAAYFPDSASLCACCRQLIRQSGILRASLYRYRANDVLLLRLKAAQADGVRHLLLEYASNLCLQTRSIARIEEYGRCIFPDHAIIRIVRNGTDRAILP